jgi:Zn-finger nucleic acid-binding protein
MECPVCGEKLREIEKFGVTVDLCPGCKGCWLDRGEIEKIAAAEAGGSGVVSSGREAGRSDSSDRSHDHKDHDDDHDHDHRKDHDDRADRGSGWGGSSSSSGKPKKRSSLLGDILGGLGGE